MTLPVRHFLVLGKSTPTYGPAPEAILRAHDNRASSGVINLVDDQPALALHVVVNAPESMTDEHPSDATINPVADQNIRYSNVNTNTRTPCENCGGEGGFAEPHGEWGLCPCCEGTGELPSSEHELINLIDLDRVFGAGPDACPEGVDSATCGRTNCPSTIGGRD